VCPNDALNDSDSDLVCDSIDVCLSGDDNLDDDEDGVPDACDACPGSDDSIDTDNDGRPDPCDICPDDPTPDSDGDGVCDSVDACPGHDDSQNEDGDALPDGCDDCPQDATGDSDGDGVCDSDDICDGADDSVDGDGDSIPDACDVCPLDNPNDSDGDGVCEGIDQCPGFDDSLDADSDTVPDGCDICAAGDDLVNSDNDALPDACDVLCPFDPYNDDDNDGVCYFNDRCLVGDDNIDEDSDEIPDACDACPSDNPNDADLDGICDGVDSCQGNNASGNTDSDAQCNDIDLDDDNDGCNDQEDSNSTTYSPDTDGDGNANDCDPCPNHNPDNIDVCGVCNGPGQLTWYGDEDGDGNGDPAVSASACNQPQGYVSNNSDPCPSHNPDNVDACNVCNGPGKFTYYADTDNDQLGDPNSITQACSLPGGYVVNSNDACPQDANNDSDGDGVCGDVDPCPSNNPDGNACGVCNFLNDTDRDTVCNAQDICEGFDDSQDADNDGKPNGCDDGFTLLFEDVEGSINWEPQPVDIDTAPLLLMAGEDFWADEPLEPRRKSFPEVSENTSFSFKYPEDPGIDGSGHKAGASQWKSPVVTLEKDNNEELPQRFVVRFSHYYDFDNGDCFEGTFTKPEGHNSDGGIVGVYDAGTWYQQTPLGGYPQKTFDIWDSSDVFPSAENRCQPNGIVGVFGLASANANQSQFVESVIDLSHFETKEINLGFRAIWDCYNCIWLEDHAASSGPIPVGWYIDDIEILRTRCGDAILEVGEYCDDDENCSGDCTYTPLLPQRGVGSDAYLDNLCPTGNVAVGFDTSDEMCMVCREFDGAALGDETTVNYKGQLCSLSAATVRCDLDADGNRTTDGVLVGVRTVLDTNGNLQESAALCQTAENALVSSSTFYSVGSVSGSYIDDRCVGGTIVKGFDFYVGSDTSDGLQFHCAPGCSAGEADVCGICGGPGLLTWYRDIDGDGKGDPNDSTSSCTTPSGYVSNNADPCPLAENDDSDGDGSCDNVDPCPSDNPNNIDACGVCNGPGPATWYRDQDDDGQGDPDTTTSSCGQPLGYVSNNTDPEPNCPTNNTDGCGVCNGPGPARWYYDGDGDGQGYSGTFIDSCSQPSNYVSNSSDPCPSNNPNGNACGACNFANDDDHDGDCNSTDPDDDNDGVTDVCELARDRVKGLFETGTYSGRSGSVGSCTGCHSNTTTSYPKYSVIRSSSSLYSYVNSDYMPMTGTKWNATDKSILLSWINCGRPW